MNHVMTATHTAIKRRDADHGRSVQTPQLLFPVLWGSVSVEEAEWVFGSQFVEDMVVRLIQIAPTIRQPRTES